MHGGVALVRLSGSAKSLLPRRVELVRSGHEARTTGGRGLLVVNPAWRLHRTPCCCRSSLLVARSVGARLIVYETLRNRGHNR